MSGTSRRGPIAADELMAELEADPEWVARREAREREREYKEAEWRKAERPLRDELQAAGIRVDSAWDLVNTSAPYPTALPILLKHLERPYPDRVREGIARSLAVREARFGWERLVELWRAEPDGTDAKTGLAVAIAAATDKSVLDELITLTRNRSHGKTRIFFLRTLARFRAWDVIEQLASDPNLGTQAQLQLKARARRRAKTQAAKK